MQELSVLLIDGESPFALAVARCLHAASGVRLHVLSNSRYVPMRFSRHCATFRVWRGHDKPGADWELVQLAQDVRADLCLAAGLPAIRFLAQQAGRLPIRVAPLPHLHHLDVAADKWAFASFLKRAGLPHPATILASTSCTRDGAFLEHLGALEFPVLLKPREGSNGIGIERFEAPDALLRRLHDDPRLLDWNIVQAVVPGTTSIAACSVTLVESSPTPSSEPPITSRTCFARLAESTSSKTIVCWAS